MLPPTSPIRAASPTPPLRLPVGSVGTLARLTIIAKPDLTRAGLTRRALTFLAEQLQGLGISFRFGPALLIDPNPEFTRILYAEHSGADAAAEYGIPGQPPSEKKPFFDTLLGPFMSGEMVKGPLVAVMIEANIDSLDALITTLRAILGTKDPIGTLRERPEQAERVRGSFRYAHGMARGARLSPIPGPDGSAALFTLLHCPASKAEAFFQQRVIYGPEDLEDHFDPSAIDTILGDPHSIPPREAVAIHRLRGTAPIETARRLQAAFASLEGTSLADVTCLVEDLSSLDILFRTAEGELAQIIGVPYDYVPPALPKSTDPAPPTRLFVVVGPRGAGKTTAANRLLTSGDVAVVFDPYVLFGDPADTGNFVVPEDAALQLLGLNVLLTTEYGPGGCYALARRSLEAFACRGAGRRGLVFGGIGMLQDLQAWARTQGHVTVHSARLAVPQAILAERLTGRGRGDDAAYAQDVATVCRGLEAQADCFEWTLDGSGSPKKTAARFIAWFEACESGSVTQKPVTTAVNLPPPVLLIQRVFRKVLDVLFNDIIKNEPYTVPLRRGKTRPADVEDYEKTLFKPKILPWLFTLLEEIYRRVHGTVPETQTAAEDLVRTVMHINYVLLAVMQMRQSFSEPTAFSSLESVDDVIRRFLGSVARAQGSEGRILGTYSALAREFNAESEEELAVIAILHDIGKADDFPFHSIRTAKLLKAMGLLEEASHFPKLGFLRFQKRLDIIYATLKHHHALGVAIISAYSLSYAKRVFRDPEVLALMWDGKKLDKKVAAKIINKLLRFAFLDMAGGSREGNLCCTYVDTLQATRDKILKALESANNPEEMCALLDDLARQETEERIARAFYFVAEERLDAEDATLFKYDLRNAVTNAIARGEITEADWQVVLDHSYRIVETPYWLEHSFSHRDSDGSVRSLEEGAKKGWVNPQFLKFQVIRSKLAEQIHRQWGKNDVILNFIGADGLPLFWREGEVKIHAALLHATTDLEFDGQTAYLQNAEGTRIAAVKIEIVLEDTIYEDPDVAHVNFKLLDA